MADTSAESGQSPQSVAAYSSLQLAGADKAAAKPMQNWYSAILCHSDLNCGLFSSLHFLTRQRHMVAHAPSEPVGVGQTSRAPRYMFCQRHQPDQLDIYGSNRPANGLAYPFASRARSVSASGPAPTGRALPLCRMAPKRKREFDIKPQLKGRLRPAIANCMADSALSGDTQLGSATHANSRHLPGHQSIGNVSGGRVHVALCRFDLVHNA